MNEETEVSRLRNDHPGKTHMVIYLQWLLCIKSRSYIRSNWERLANEFCYLARMWMFHLPADHSYRTHSLVQSSISTRRYPCPLLVHFLWRVLLRSCFSFLLWTESLGNHLRVWQEINKPMKKPMRKWNQTAHKLKGSRQPKSYRNICWKLFHKCQGNYTINPWFAARQKKTTNICYAFSSSKERQVISLSSLFVRWVT